MLFSLEVTMMRGYPASSVQLVITPLKFSVLGNISLFVNTSSLFHKYMGIITLPLLK